MPSLIKDSICHLWVLATAGEHNWIMLGLLKTGFLGFLSLGSKILIWVPAMNWEVQDYVKL